MSEIGVVILNYNSTRVTKKCVQSLLRAKDTSDVYHVVVFDNDSSVPPKKTDFPGAQLVHSKQNVGFAQGNNEAVAYLLSQYPETEYLVLLNSDTRVTKGMMRSLVERLQSSPNAGMVLPKIYFEKGYEYFSDEYEQNQKGKVIWYVGGSIDWANAILTHKGIDEVDRGQFFDAQIQDFATGCCLVTTPVIWKKLKGFDQKYFLYYEDADLSVRLRRKLGKEIIVEPKAILYHQNAGSSQGSGSAVHQYYQTRNRLRFGLTHAPRRTQLALLLEARRLFLSGNPAVRLGILHALGGTWGNQTHNIPVEKRSAQ